MKNSNQPEKLHWTFEGLIKRLFLAIMADIDRTFASYGLTYLPGQREAIERIVIAVLNFVEGKVTAIPLVPGGGKSTVLRSLLRVISRFIADGVEGILDYIGGIVVVVQTIAEMHKLEAICQEAAHGYPICTVIESPNETNLKNGGCIAGIATCNDECLGKDCDCYNNCKIVRSTRNMQKNPVLAITHARYARYLENPEPLLPWTDQEGNMYRRKMVLVDEAPELTDLCPLNASFINTLSGLVCNAKYFRWPDVTNARWRSCVQNRYFALQFEIYKINQPIVSSDTTENEDMVQTNENEFTKPAGEKGIIFDIISADMMDLAGFNETRYIDVCTKLQTNSKNPKMLHDARRVIDALYSDREKYYSIMDGETTVYCPRLKEPHGEGKPASFFFSGTCNNNPELSENPNIEVLDCGFSVDSSRLTVNIQRSNYAKFSKSASKSANNYATILAWVKHNLDLARDTHERVMVMTYQKVAGKMYRDLVEDYGDVLVPYPEKDGAPPKMLPYFGGTNGSNDYNRSTYFIQAGLNRFKPTDYLNRAIAMISVSPKWADMAVSGKSESAKVMMEAMQAELLANDSIQGMYRIDLRNHSSSKCVVVDLYEPPEATVDAIKQQFPDATFIIIPELSEDVIFAALDHRTYGPKQTHGAALEQFLRRRLADDPVTPVTPKVMQDGAGLSDEEYNTARKSPQLKKFMDEHFLMTGRGRNCTYTPVGSADMEASS